MLLDFRSRLPPFPTIQCCLNLKLKSQVAQALCNLSVTISDIQQRLLLFHTRPKLKLSAMIILRNSGHGANIRVCMGIFTIGFRTYKYCKVLNKNDIPCF